MRIILAVLALSLPAHADVVKLSGTTPVISCEKLKGELKPFQEPYHNKDVTGTAVGYQWHSAKVLTKILYHDQNDKIKFDIQHFPSLTQRESGCFYQFDVKSPQGYRFKGTPLKFKAKYLHNMIPAEAIKY